MFISLTKEDGSTIYINRDAIDYFYRPRNSQVTHIQLRTEIEYEGYSLNNQISVKESPVEIHDRL